MKIEISKNQIELTPDTLEEEVSLRKAKILPDGVTPDLIWWGSTHPEGEARSGVKIHWI